MQHLFKISALGLLLGLVSCHQETKQAKNEKKVIDTEICTSAKMPIHITLQPFKDFSKQEAEFIKKGLEEHYHSEITINEPIDFPKNSFNGRRYRADVIIRDLSKKVKVEKCYKSVIVGLTHKDISTSYKGNPDWGVIGLGYIGGVSCVTSSYRLQNPKQQILATAHEIGHNVGLNHCDENGCIMQDAKGKNMFSQHREFSKSCAEKAYKNNVFVKKNGELVF